MLLVFELVDGYSHDVMMMVMVICTAVGVMLP